MKCFLFITILQVRYEKVLSEQNIKLLPHFHLCTKIPSDHN